MGFQRLFIIAMLILIGSVPNASLAKQPSSANTELAQAQTPIQQPTEVDVLPLVKWDSINVTVVEGMPVWLALRTDTPIQNTSGIKIDIQLYTETSPITGADIGDDFERDIFLPQTNRSKPNAITGYISGTTQVLYIQLQTVSDTFVEKNEVFYVDVVVSNGTIESRGNRATVTIAKEQKFYPAFADWQSCQDVGEPANNSPAKSGLLAASGGVCKGDFAGENAEDADYYRISQSVGGSLTLRLKNTTGQNVIPPTATDQHDLDLYLYKYNSTTGRYDEVARSVNDAQLDDVITFQIVANTSNDNGLYLVAAYWAVSTGNKIPTYDLTATLQ